MNDSYKKYYFIKKPIYKIQHEFLHKQDIRPMIKYIKHNYNNILTGVEVGTYKGLNAKNILGEYKCKIKFIKKMSFDAIDEIPMATTYPLRTIINI